MIATKLTEKEIIAMTSTVAQAMGKKGGKSRAKKYPKEKLSEWGAKGGWKKGVKRGK